MGEPALAVVWGVFGLGMNELIDCWTVLTRWMAEPDLNVVAVQYERRQRREADLSFKELIPINSARLLAFLNVRVLTEASDNQRVFGLERSNDLGFSQVHIWL